MAISKQAQTLQGTTLSEGNTFVTSTDGKRGDGVFLNPSSVECVEDGDLAVKWTETGSEQVLSFVQGQSNPILCFSVRVVLGTFNIGHE